MTRKNFILGKELKNKEITIYCQSPVSIHEAYRVFVSALSAHKLSLVKVGKFYRVVKAKDAVKGPSPTFIDGRMNEVPYDERMVTVLHKLRHLDGDNLQGAQEDGEPSGPCSIVPPRFADLGYGDERHRLMRWSNTSIRRARRTRSITRAQYADAATSVQAR